MLQEDPYGGAEARANGLTNGENICSHFCVVLLACGSSICIACFSHKHQVDRMQTDLSESALMSVTLTPRDICSQCCVVLLACGSSICIACFSHKHQVDRMETGLSESALKNVTLTPGDICRRCCAVFPACGSSICIACFSHKHQVDRMETDLSERVLLNVTLVPENICSRCCVVLPARGSSICIACRSHEHHVNRMQTGLSVIQRSWMSLSFLRAYAGAVVQCFLHVEAAYALLADPMSIRPTACKQVSVSRAAKLLFLNKHIVQIHSRCCVC